MRTSFLFLAGAAAGSFLALTAAAGSAAPGAEIAGHWLAVDYAKALEKSRSPIAAIAGTNLVALLVEPATEGPPGYNFSVTSFHEGLNYRIQGFQQQGAVARIEADSFDDDTSETQTLLLELTKAPDGGRLAAGTLWGEDRVLYRLLPGTVNQYVNGLVIAGSYLDDQKKTYVFGADGKLDWAGSQRTYDVTIDTYENSCDTFSYNDPAKGEDMVWIGFRRSGAELSLYELVEGQEHMFDCAKKPFLVLHQKPRV